MPRGSKPETEDSLIVKVPDERFPTAPEGSFPAVCVDEIDLGKVTSTWSGEERTRNMVRLVFQIDEVDADGKRYLVKQDYTASLHEKSGLRKTLRAWRGREFTPAELFGFDLETVVGAPCMVSIVHNVGHKGGTFANVSGIMKLPKGMTQISPEGYIRVKDRVAPKDGPALVSQPRQRPPVEEQPPQDFVTDDDVPF
jgi:hypothetical protein